MFFRRRTHQDLATGLFLAESGLGIANIRHQKGRKAQLTKLAWHPDVNDEIDADRLGKVIEGKQPVHLVLDDRHYQLLLVEAPRVEPSELRAAVRWKVKNLIDFHVDDAVIDVFEIPGQHNRPAGQAMMYAIAAKASEIRSRIDLCESAGLNLQVIDVTEMALRNLAAQLEQDVRGVGLLYLDQSHGVITLTRQANLYLSRRIEAGHEQLALNFDGEIEQITLEIQRSLDYYDSHFGQPPLAALRVVPGFDRQDALVAALAENLPVDTALYDLEDAIDCKSKPIGEAPPGLLLAIGAALRREERSL